MIQTSPRCIALVQSLFKTWYCDQCEVRFEVDGADGYGSAVQTYPPQSPPVFYKGHLREVERIPGIPDLAGTTPVVGNFIIHLEAGAIVRQKAMIIVNGGDQYIIENIYEDKANRFSTQCYCYRLK